MEISAEPNHFDPIQRAHAAKFPADELLEVKSA